MYPAVLRVKLYWIFDDEIIVTEEYNRIIIQNIIRDTKLIQRYVV